MNIRFHYELRKGQGLVRSTFIISSVSERNSLNLVSLPKKEMCALEGYESNHSSLIQDEVTSSSQE